MLTYSSSPVLVSRSSIVSFHFVLLPLTHSLCHNHYGNLEILPRGHARPKPTHSRPAHARSEHYLLLLQLLLVLMGSYRDRLLVGGPLFIRWIHWLEVTPVFRSSLSGMILGIGCGSW
ncbi:hypothetical protein HOY82DRAFT_566277 [Tuber indicum]|nr:hypothetical protein HOY82DRAFT_566277 [Tuber indicum]